MRPKVWPPWSGGRSSRCSQTTVTPPLSGEAATSEVLSYQDSFETSIGSIQSLFGATGCAATLEAATAGWTPLLTKLAYIDVTTSKRARIGSTTGVKLFFIFIVIGYPLYSD